MKAQWTYSSEKFIAGYWSPTQSAQNEMIETMTRVYELLSEKNIPLTVVIYPWPQQLEFDRLNSKHTSNVGKILRKQMQKFYQSFPRFF